jgi:hypothetical protein
MTNLEIALILFNDLHIRAIQWYDMTKITYNEFEIDDNSFSNKVKNLNPIANEYAVKFYIMAMTEEEK